MNRISVIGTAAAAAVLASVALPAGARDDKQDVTAAADREWLTLTGKVSSVAGDQFTLDYGRDDIVVEMDDYDWYNENALVVGDSVTVSGRMDKDFFDTRSIEARSVYVDSLNEYFYASAADEEQGIHLPLLHDHLQDDEWVSLTGEVASINGEDIVLDTGAHEYDVDAGGLAYNPFDADGTERIQVGERVVVFGQMDDADLFDDREIEATTITTLSRSG